MRKLLLLFIFAVLFFVSKAQTIKQAAGDEQQLGKSGLFKSVTFNGKRYFVCTVDPQKYKIELFTRLQNSEVTYSFSTIAAIKKKDLLFAMNGGMFEPDFNPVGLYISNNKVYNPLNTREGGGNFYALKPNGVFIIEGDNTPLILTSEKFALGQYKPAIGTQSGPVLVTDGSINSNFKESSVNLNIRNGVGVTKNNQVVFAVSIDKVNFYEFSELFRDVLRCGNALYLDGFVSQYYAPELQPAPLPGAPLGVFIIVGKK